MDSVPPCLKLRQIALNRAHLREFETSHGISRLAGVERTRVQISYELEFSFSLEARSVHTGHLSLPGLICRLIAFYT